MTAGPEISRLLKEYELKDILEVQNADHHEQIPSVQSSFTADVKNLVTVIDSWGSPFMEESAELFAIDTKVMVSNDGVHQIRTAEALGGVQYASFIEEHVN